MTAHYDRLETRPQTERQMAQFACLMAQIAHAKANAPYYRDVLRDVDPAAIADRTALAALPLTRKSDLIALQRATPPLGGLATVPPTALRRLFQSPGPIYDVQGHARDYWRLGRALHAAGIRAGDLVHVGFSYHLTPAAMMIEEAAAALGCVTFAGGTGNTEQQVQALADLGATAYAGTPSLLSILLDRARELGVRIAALKRASVAAEALPAALRERFAAEGIHVRQWYGTADVGLIAYEAEALPGLIVDEGVLVEIVRPGTGEPVADGEVGEVVVTLLHAPEYPLIRFATGDLSRFLPGESRCGRTNVRLEGWLGRADQAVKVRGLFVHPAHITEVMRRHPQLLRARLVIARRGLSDDMTLKCEVDPSAEGSLPTTDDLAETLQLITRLRGTVQLLPLGSLPNDGKVIEDLRNLT
jgi:phenylacetate-CoA ligase